MHQFTRVSCRGGCGSRNELALVPARGGAENMSANGAEGISDIEYVGLGSRRMDGQAAEGRGAELGKRSINTSRSGIARIDGNAAR
jgi:hypothetical protein